MLSDSLLMSHEIQKQDNWSCKRTQHAVFLTQAINSALSPSPPPPSVFPLSLLSLSSLSFSLSLSLSPSLLYFSLSLSLPHHSLSTLSLSHTRL